jgi:hypothetical protein
MGKLLEMLLAWLTARETKPSSFCSIIIILEKRSHGSRHDTGEDNACVNSRQSQGKIETVAYRISSFRLPSPEPTWFWCYELVFQCIIISILFNYYVLFIAIFMRYIIEYKFR